MKNKLHTLLLIGLAFTAGCTSSKQIPVCKVCSAGASPAPLTPLSASKLKQIAAQAKVYRRLLSKIQPGMTRRELYAILPPRETPSAETPIPFSSLESPPSYVPLTESYHLDHDFRLFTQYRIAQASEYPRPSPLPRRTYKSKSAHDLDPALEAYGGRTLQQMPSRQNPNDELIARPELMAEEGPSTPMYLLAVPYNELYIEKAQKSKAR